jgi:hypothetical protein
LTATLCLGVASEAAAQFRFGLNGGFSASKMVGDEIEASDSNFGTFLGLALEYDLSMDWQLDLEAVLHQKGGDKVVGPAGVPFDMRIDYFELPLTISRHFWLSGGPWSLSPFAGFSVGLNMKCTYRVPAGDREIEFEPCDEIGVEAPGTFYGVPVGLALRRKYPGGSAFNVEARYTLGLSAGVSAGEIEASSNSFSILMSFLFPGSSRGYGTPDAPNPNR